jgi:hypothetical protein
MFAAQALEAAEAGLSDVLINADPASLEGLALGGLPLDLGPLAVGTRATTARQIVRLTNSLFFVRCTGTRWDAGGNPLATRSIGLLVRVAPLTGAAPARLSPVGERAWVQLS